MAITGTLLPGTDLVSVEWLKRNPLLTSNGISVATKLPLNDPAALVSGFITTQIVGGQKMSDLPFRQPVVAINSWAMPATAGSAKTPWHRADAIMQWIMAMVDDPAFRNVVISSFPAGYRPARVSTVIPVGEARRIENDPGGAARFELNATMNWSLN